MGIDIRIAAPADAVAACKVLRRSIQECCEQDHRDQPAMLESWLGNKTPQTVAGWFSSPSHFSLVAERDGALVGVALLTQAGILSLCYVLPEALHSGVGKALLAGIEAQARQWNISVLRLHSTATASGFFARHGYVNAGKEKSCYGLECDFLWKHLNAETAAEASSRKRFCNCSVP
jgi:N-acetylglutamate synthase-like GNAT family acetyltransferase